VGRARRCRRKGCSFHGSTDSIVSYRVVRGSWEEQEGRGWKVADLLVSYSTPGHEKFPLAVCLAPAPRLALTQTQRLIAPAASMDDSAPVHASPLAAVSREDGTIPREFESWPGPNWRGRRWM
jgi:hypothetical protein